MRFGQPRFVATICAGVAWLAALGVTLAAASANAQVLHERFIARPLDCREGLCTQPQRPGKPPSALPAAVQTNDGKLIEPPPVEEARKIDEPLWTPDALDGPKSPAPPGESPSPPNAASHRRGDYQIDRETGPESGNHPYEEVFSPSIYPFKRTTTLDAVVDGPCTPARAGCVEPALAVAHEQLEVMAVQGSSRGDAAYDYFWGTINVELEGDRWTPLPSPGANAILTAYDVEPRQTLEFAVDGAENWVVRGSRSGRHRIVWMVAVPRAYFGGAYDRTATIAALAPSLVPHVSPAVQALVKPILRELGVASIGKSTRLATVVDRLVEYFRNFEPRELTTSASSGSTYIDLVRAQAGSCRHRSFAFVVTAQALGIAARYVENELHVFVEVYLPGTGWRRVHLGGAGVESTRIGERGPEHKDPEDPFPKPPKFVANEAAAPAQKHAAATGNGGSGGGSGRGSGSGSGKRTGNSVNDPRGAPNGTIRPVVEFYVELAGSSTFRGEASEIHGRAMSDDQPAALLPIWVELVGSAKLRVAEGVTDADGRFVIPFEVPRAIALGDYRVIVGTDGDPAYAPSITR